MSEIILEEGSQLFLQFQQLIKNADRVFFAGLPGVGKSLLLQQLTLMARNAKRKVHLLQWDTARPVFETPDVLAKYPIVDGATHPMVIKAVSVWSRTGILEWDKSHEKPDNILIGEVPLVGNRLMELVRPADDEAESILRDDRTQLFIPVPSRSVRQVIESNREQTIADPQHENETQDAPPNLLMALWHDLYRIAKELGLTELKAETMPYDPEIYSGVYQHLLQHRHFQVLNISEALKPSGSVYDYDEELPELSPTPQQAKAILAKLEQEFTLEQILADAEQWYVV